MTEQQLYTLVHEELYKTGSCVPNVWRLLKIADGERVAIFEAIQPRRGNIKIRRTIKKQRINDEGKEIWLYNLYRFTNKKELKDDGLLEDVRPDHEEG
ncbi:hypothetical protein PQ478_08715 [Alkalihalophilus pseudofirmus]|uniref:hypothetical protein n=1 Tax=Alkalihalophilus pseudofirmus TaxID=79885 RepID=UPI00259B6D99|nr:hypothetical protein [Alkalihalophilus pseudofirmus]WEG18551.1 hypothetical protein PQ478_08715 [Alkalihalophilus pseudofirmus]